jgi:starch synthase
MRIVLASSEAVPFSKTGGLADVATALAKALAAAGHDVSLIVPHYPMISAARGVDPETFQPTGLSVDVPVGGKQITGSLLKTSLPDSSVSIYLVDQPAYFARGQLYTENGSDYPDNCERFSFFSRAVLEAARLLDLRPDIIHANDWQTALVPAVLEIEYGDVAGFEETASVITIHNLAFQGQSWHWDMLQTGLDWEYFNWRQLEFFGDLNLLKGGLVFADKITTVSPTYAEEIQTEKFGCGLHGVLENRRDDLVGILNGIDPTIWNPATDPALAKNYTADDFEIGKAACKADLQKRLGLPQRDDVPLFGMISRLADQKGFDILIESAEELLSADLQFCVLGTGDAAYEAALRNLASRFPKQVSATIGFDETLAHVIEAGSDFYLMPSRYEPCGLNQMYSLAYGAVPIVTPVGGLADTVVDCTPGNIKNETATGLVLAAYDGGELVRKVTEAVAIYANRPDWENLVRNGMRRDWSWTRSAQAYVDLYKQAITSRLSPLETANAERKETIKR